MSIDATEVNTEHMHDVKSRLRRFVFLFSIDAVWEYCIPSENDVWWSDVVWYIVCGMRTFPWWFFNFGYSPYSLECRIVNHWTENLCRKTESIEMKRCARKFVCVKRKVGASSTLTWFAAKLFLHFGSNSAVLNAIAIWIVDCKIVQSFIEPYRPESSAV